MSRNWSRNCATCARSTCTAWAHHGPAPIVAQPDPALAGANPALTTLSADLNMVNAASAATVVHSHTWYAGMAGHLAALLYGVPHVLTAHSLEPMRPWKAEQLGGGYRISSWVEKHGRRGRGRGHRGQFGNAQGRTAHLSGPGS